MPTDTPEAWGREALLYLRKYKNLFSMSKRGECPECGADRSLDKTHFHHCPLASLIERGEAMFKENE